MDDRLTPAPAPALAPDVEAGEARAEGAAVVPRATYRLQFHAGFGFAAATALVPMLARLGVSHVYCSPYLAARPGSTHGYDVVDHGRLNPELGSEADFAAFVAALRAHGLGQILDFVPNHVGIGGHQNRWWLEVLEWGRDAPLAKAFDVDWAAPGPDLCGRLLVPLLGEPYGVALEAGRIELRFEPAAGEFAAWIPGEHKLPLCPTSYPALLPREGALEPLSVAFRGLARLAPAARVAQAAALKTRLAACVAEDAAARAGVERALRRLAGRPGRAASFRALDRLLSRQHWRVACWRVAADDINYRRFFNITELAGLRVEDPEVFAEAHRWVLPRLADGTLAGLRIDHVDGLFDPAQYCRRLREAVPRPFHLVVEKILAAHERLPEALAVDGTTGYEFAAWATGLQVDPAGEAALTEGWTRFTGEPGDAAAWAALVVECKRLIMDTELASELHGLALEAARIARSDWHGRDFTLNGLRDTLAEIVAHYPVYRTYIRRGEDGRAQVAPEDRRHVAWAVARARRSQRPTEDTTLDFLERLLLGERPGRRAGGAADALDPVDAAILRFAMKVQQFTGPVTAKAVEDTAFYRYNRLLALNEVGAQPERFGRSVAAFHRAMAEVAQRHPATLLATSTHDTKRGEDARARLAVLSEMPEEWSRAVHGWSRLVRARRGEIGAGGPPAAADEWAFFQLLLASWPAATARDPALPLAPGALDELGERLREALRKSAREARRHTSWARPDEAYETGLLDYVGAALDLSRPNLFLEQFRPVLAEVVRHGMVNGLAQTVLKLTAPGVPDIYRGAEGWDLSLVDPDNRRPVDHALGARQLEAVAALDDLAPLLAHWEDGSAKRFVIHRLLQHRTQHPALFARGEHVALEAQGTAAGHVVAFARRLGDAVTVTIVPRLPATLGRQPDGWGDTLLDLSGLGGADGWRSLLEPRRIVGPLVSLGELLSRTPVAVLER
ncbi:MAG: malto-oligosyltrehalose synthase [Steroidobacteraceae bacterium]|nr:malto-oligosyltrehalose synthase [Steroidobacteraceae bacterium]